MIVYEQPLSEKIRLFMRLEHLFERFDHHVENPSVDRQAAIVLLLELHEMATRLDVKSAIMKIIDYQTIVIKKYQGESNTNEEKISNIISTLEEKTKELYNFHGQFNQHVAGHFFLNSVKQRLSTSGGLNAFDAPVFNLWMNQPVEKRTEQLLEWVEPYNKSREAIILVLDLIRKSADEVESMAKNGFYQSTLSERDKTRNFQLLRVHLPKSYTYYPEISAGRQRFSIRFSTVEDLSKRSKQVQDDVPFLLSICGF